MQKSARSKSRRGVRWATRSSNTLRSDGSLTTTKRPHGVINILDREVEAAANGAGSHAYQYGASYVQRQGGRATRYGSVAMSTTNPNRNVRLCLPAISVLFSIPNKISPK